MKILSKHWRQCGMALLISLTLGLQGCGGGSSSSSSSNTTSSGQTQASKSSSATVAAVSTVAM